MKATPYDPTVLKIARKKKYGSQGNFAEALEVSRMTVIRLEAGREVSLKLIQAACDKLKLDFSIVISPSQNIL